MPIRIEALRREHNRDGFDCGEASLNFFIRSLVTQHDARNLGRTFVAVQDDEARVLGYYTLATGEVTFDSLPNTKKLPHNMPVPVVLLGRLAVGTEAQGKKLGEMLLLHALWRTHMVSEQVAVHAVEVDAINEKAAEFYARYGFVPLRDSPWHMYLPLETIKNLPLDF